MAIKVSGTTVINDSRSLTNIASIDAGTETTFTTSGFTTNTGTATLTNKTLNGVILNDGYTEEIFAVTGTTPALSPTNGSIQTWTLSGNSTPTLGTWDAGQSVTFMIDDGTASTITWPTITWVGGSAPTLSTTGYNIIVLWKVDTVVYGLAAGNT